MKLIVGLGNPGKEYENTRHNIGFMVLDYMKKNEKWKEKFDAFYIKDDDVIYLKPLTYMNVSGFAVEKAANFFKIKPEDILVIQDDLDLPFNNYKLKRNSSAGGHNGIRSIIACLGTNSFLRLKIGIAHDRSIDTKDYVLSKFAKQNLEELESKFSLYEEIINYFIKNDAEKTISKYNAMR
ncbi:MAG: aminoacyl-tRNA hydrolase [Firmicutes bacterium]|nr:aminoacyl-tRNA hydrolase [Bacillota bacterium]